MDNHGICAKEPHVISPKLAGIVPEALLIQPGAVWHTPSCSDLIQGHRCLLEDADFNARNGDGATNKADTSPVSMGLPILWERQTPGQTA